MSTAELSNSLIQEFISHSHFRCGTSSLLTTRIHTTPYRLSKEFKTRHKKLKNCLKCICRVLVLIIILCVSLFGAIKIIEIADETKQYGKTFNIEGSCEIIEVKTWSGPGGAGRAYVYIVNITTFDLSCSAELADDFFSCDPCGTAYVETDYNMGDIVQCYTNQDCDNVFLSNTVNDYSGIYSTSRSQYWGAYIVIIVFALCLCFTIYAVLTSMEMIKTRTFICFCNRENNEACRCNCKMKNISGCNTFYYLGNKCILDYYFNQWNFHINNSQQFDYFMSYYSSKYRIDLSRDVYKMIYEYADITDMMIVPVYSKKHSPWKAQTNRFYRCDWSATGPK